jgi:hypothetical protein
MRDQSPESTEGPAIEGGRTKLLIAGVVIFALIAVSALGAITYMAVTLPEDRAVPESRSEPAPAPRQATSTGAAPAPVVPAAKGEATSPGSETLSKYSETVEPLLVETRKEMEGVIIDLKGFLKTVNRTNSSKETKKVIDEFRARLNEREQRLATLSSSLKAVAPPSGLQQQHDRLSQGVVKYVLSVQSYIRGLSAYSFNQISASQNDLEAADREIKAATDEFQKALAHLTLQKQ